MKFLNDRVARFALRYSRSGLKTARTCTCGILLLLLLSVPGPSRAQDLSIDPTDTDRIAITLTAARSESMVAMEPSAPGVLRLVGGGVPEGVTLAWLDRETGEQLAYDEGIFVGAARSVGLSVRLAGAPESSVDVDLRVDFSPEPYAEPDDTIADARPLDPGTEMQFRLMPRVDRDVFAVTAPADGALIARVLDGGGHPRPSVIWRGADGEPLRSDNAWEPTIRVTAGTTYYAEFRSDDDYWQEVALETPLTVRVDFSPEPYAEPDDTIADARPLEPEDLLLFRLMPRVDRDFFAIVVPQSGELVLELVDSGGHPRLTPAWYDVPTGEQLAFDTWTLPAERGQHIAVEFRSDDDYWQEVALEATVKVLFRLRLPDGRWANATEAAGEITIAPWQTVVLEPAEQSPLIRLKAPQDGYYRIGTGSHDLSAIWSDLNTGGTLEGDVQWLRASQEMSIELRGTRDEPANERQISLTLELMADGVSPPTGAYPRSAPDSLAGLFAEDGN